MSNEDINKTNGTGDDAGKKDKKTAVARTPFWAPLGALGCLWRSIVFLAGILLLCVLMALLFRGCSGTHRQWGGEDREWENRHRGDERHFEDQDNRRGPEAGEDEDNREGNDRDPFRDPEKLREELPDTIPTWEERERAPRVPGWSDSIPGVPELPSPRENYIPPVDSTVIVPDPTDPYGQIVGDQLNVFFNSNDAKADITKFAQRFKQLYPGSAYSVAYYNVEAGTMILSVPTSELEQVAENLERSITDIDFFVTTNDNMIENVKPSDPVFGNKYLDSYLDLIQAFDAWDITKGSPDVKVAIVDSYFDLTNPEIGSRYVDPIHIPSKTRAVQPPNRLAANGNEYTYFTHGSHVAGLAIGAQDNGMGASGIAPNCTWIPVALGEELTAFNIVEGVLYAIYHGADVVNLSIGRSFPADIDKQVSLEEQVDYVKKYGESKARLWEYVGKVAADHNCIIVTSAGNETILMGMDAKNRANNIIKVEATDEKGIKADFSNYGMVPEDSIRYSTVAAPGTFLWSVYPKQSIPFARQNGIETSPDGFGAMSGTSMASPVVAGAVALLKSKKKDATPDEIIKVLRMTARQTDTKNRIGPTIQIADALNAIGGELLNFDDLMKDHDKLVGKWKSTKELEIHNSNDVKIDNMWTYFIFDTPTSGHIEHHCINTGKVYTTGLSVRWGTNEIVITQAGDARTAQGDVLTRDDFQCRPNKDRLLEADCMSGNVKRYSFMLEKVK